MCKFMFTCCQQAIFSHVVDFIYLSFLSLSLCICVSEREKEEKEKTIKKMKLIFSVVNVF